MIKFLKSNEIFTGKSIELSGNTKSLENNHFCHEKVLVVLEKLFLRNNNIF